MTTNETLQRLGIEQLNAMQQDTMQAYRKAESLVLLSPTGSGKTLAYLLPLLQTLNAKCKTVQALVIVPSRELALQTHEVVRQTGSAIRSIAVYGGRPAMEEHRSMRGIMPQLVIGTPGRLLDHLTKGNLATDHIDTLIIDEFDKCLELGFRDEMAQVFRHLGGVRKRMLLSATDNPEITSFLPEYTRLDYLAPEDDRERIEEYIVRSPAKDKLETLGALLRMRGGETSLVFVGFRESVERVAKYLREEGFYASALHGGMEQRDRERALYRFVGGSANILVSTDLASRGLDIPQLNNVIHYHLPLNQETYTHRNGRTARWDRQGRVFLILGPEENFTLRDAGELEDLGTLAPCGPETPTIPMPQWETLYIGKGKRDKLSRGDIAGFLMKVGRLERDEVGRIDVRDHWSFAAVSRSRVGEVLKRLRGQKIKGIKTLIERMK